MGISVTEELYWAYLLTSHSQFLPCKTPTGARFKLSSSLLSTNPNKENQWSNLLSCWCLHNPISVPVFALPLLIALMRLESKLKNPAIVSAARSYDSENTEPADLVSKMELFSPHPTVFFLNNLIRKIERLQRIWLFLKITLWLKISLEPPFRLTPVTGEALQAANFAWSKQLQKLEYLLMMPLGFVHLGFNHARSRTLNAFRLWELPA